MSVGDDVYTAAVHTPIHIPSWVHIAELLRRNGRGGRLVRSEAFKHLPMLLVDDLTDVVDLKNPIDGERCGLIPKIQLFGPTPATPHYPYFSRVVAPIAW